MQETKCGVRSQLPLPTLGSCSPRSQRNIPRRPFFGILVLLAISVCLYALLSRDDFNGQRLEVVPLDANSIVAKCRSLHVTPSPLPNFHARAESDRFQPGTDAVLIRNATIWTGELNGSHVVYGDVLLDKGIIRSVGEVSAETVDSRNLLTVDAHG